VLCYSQHSFKLVVVHYLLKDWREKTWRNRPDATGKRTKPITRAQLITEGVLSSKYLCVCVSTTSSVSASFTRVLTSSVISLKKRKGWKKDWKPVLHLSVWHRGARFIKWRVSGLFKLVGTCVVSAHTHTHTASYLERENKKNSNSSKLSNYWHHISICKTCVVQVLVYPPFSTGCTLNLLFFGGGFVTIIFCVVDDFVSMDGLM
jgi:hypothetical protein